MTSRTRSNTLRGLNAYPTYRDTGIVSLGQTPAHWRMGRLKELVPAITVGIVVTPAKYYVNEGIACLRSLNISRGTVDMTDLVFISPSANELHRKSKIFAGDLLVVRTGKAGTAVVVPPELDGTNCIDLLIIRKSRTLDSRFLYYFVNSSAASTQVEVSTKGAIQEHYNTGTLAELQVPELPLEEQRAIATFLDRETARIDELLAKKERLIELLQEKRTALITRAVTKGLNPSAPRKDANVDWLDDFPDHWTATRLKYVASKIVDCPHETPRYSEYGEYHVLRTSDVSEGGLDVANSLRVDASEYRDRIRRLPLVANDVVYSREGERFGFAAIVPIGVSACLGQRMMQIRFARTNDARFMMWQLNGRSVYQQAQIANTGSTSPHVNVDTIRNFWVVVPPWEEQRAIASLLDNATAQTNRVVARVRDAIDHLMEYRTALISAAVTGKIDVREEVA